MLLFTIICMVVFIVLTNTIGNCSQKKIDDALDEVAKNTNGGCIFVIILVIIAILTLIFGVQGDDFM